MYVVYCILILFGVYVGVSKKMDAGVKAFIIVSEIVIFVLSVVSAVLGG